VREDGVAAKKKKRKALPSKKIEKLAFHALADDNFRKAASKHPGFRKVLANELKNPKLGFHKITEEEAAYCEGWLRLARLQFGETYFDDKLKIAISEEIEQGKILNMTG
jgi:hypothetical protein